MKIFENDFQKYWIKKDPLFLTEYNERQLEHYARITYVDFRFNLPEQNNSAWETEQGESIIRYGEPQYLFATKRVIGLKEPAKSMGIALSPIGKSDSESKKDLLHQHKAHFSQLASETWYYPGFYLQFKDYSGLGRFSFYDPMPNPNTPHIKLTADKLAEIPEFYDNPYIEKMIPMITSCVDYRGSEGKTLLEICYGVPLKLLSPKLEEDVMTVRLKQGMYFFDEGWNEQLKSTSDRTIHRDVSFNLDDSLNFMFIDLQKVYIVPGDYHFFFEIKSKDSDKIGQWRQKIKIPSYTRKYLQLSGIGLAYHIDSMVEKKLFTKNNLFILPNPTKKYNTDQTAYVYYEIYNLKLSEDGISHFLVETTISTVKKNEKLITRMLKNFGNLVGVMEKTGAITLSYEYQNSNVDEFLFFALDVHGLNEGTYMLKILIRDLIANNKVKRETSMIIG